MRRKKPAFLYRSVKDGLLRDIHEGRFKPGQLLPYEKQLCEQYEVSLITVRRALAELAEEGIITKKTGRGSIVIGTASDSASVPEMEESSVGVLIIDLKRSDYPFRLAYSNDWAARIVSSLSAQLGPRCQVFSAGFAADTPVDQLAFSPIASVRRVLVLGGWRGDHIGYLLAQGKKVVLYNNFDDSIQVPSVNNNDRSSCFDAVTYFITSGHRRIAVINGPFDYGESRERYIGYQNALQDGGLDIDPRLVKWGDYSPESGYVLMKELLAGSILPTAVFCGNDTVAGGAYEAMKEAGLSCPDDISLFGHDNLSFAHEIGGGLCSVDPNLDEVGKQLANLLLLSDPSPQRVIVESTLSIRSSVARFGSVPR